jgi:hypothetical protein
MINPIARIGISAAALVAGFLATPAFAQDGNFMRQVLGHIGIFPPEKDPITYNDRPGLVVPKDTNRLRPPEEADPSQRNAAWPVDPDRERRRLEEARRNQPAEQLLGRRAVDGRRLTVDELAAGRVQRGTPMGEPRVPGNDKAEVRVGPEEWSRISRTATAGPALTPGVEPPRQYLTDPPVGLRMPAAGAPVARTNDGPAPELLENNRPGDAWRRLD